jgi:hypothetical protein
MQGDRFRSSSAAQCNAGNLGALGGNSIVQDARPLLLVTTVDIGAGRSDRLEIRRGDDPAEVAAAFAAKHNLPTAVIPRLAAHLRDNVAKVEDLAMVCVASRWLW